jgi:hypothetical protein
MLKILYKREKKSFSRRRKMRAKKHATAIINEPTLVRGGDSQFHPLQYERFTDLRFVSLLTRHSDGLF